MNSRISILVIYTGGTIGMVNDPETGSLTPFDFNHIMNEIPELNKFGYKLASITLDEIVDSSNITPDTWIHLAKLIDKHYHSYDGFVILHGTSSQPLQSLNKIEMNKVIHFTTACHIHES